MGRRHWPSEASANELDHALYVGLSSTDFQHGCDCDAPVESLCEFLQSQQQYVSFHMSASRLSEAASNIKHLLNLHLRERIPKHSPRCSSKKSCSSSAILLVWVSVYGSVSKWVCCSQERVIGLLSRQEGR